MSGQACFDFILDDADKHLYCIECASFELPSRLLLAAHVCVAQDCDAGEQGAGTRLQVGSCSVPCMHTLRSTPIAVYPVLDAGNPRTSTNILSFYDDPRLALAFFDPSAIADRWAPLCRAANARSHCA